MPSLHYMGFEIWRCVKLAICCSETQRTLILCSVLCIPLRRLAACRAPGPTSSTAQHCTRRAVHICHGASPRVSHRGPTCSCTVWTRAQNLLLATQGYALKWGRKVVVGGVGDVSEGFAPSGCKVLKGLGKFGAKKGGNWREVGSRSTFPSYNVRRWVIISPALPHHITAALPPNTLGLGRCCFPAALLSLPSSSFSSLCGILWSGTIPEIKTAAWPDAGALTFLFHLFFLP